MRAPWLALLVCSPLILRGASFPNPGFEAGLDRWRFWTRDANAGSFVLDIQQPHEGKQCVRVEHRATQDWSLEPAAAVSCEPGEVFELDLWVCPESEGSFSWCVSTWDANNKAVDWSHGARSPTPGPGWQRLHSRVVVPEGIVRIQPRLIGYGSCAIRADDFSLKKQPGFAWRKNPSLSPALKLQNGVIELGLNTSNATLSVKDLRTGRVWKQQAQASALVLLDATASAESLELKMFDPASSLALTGLIRTTSGTPEFTIELSAPGGSELRSPIRFPGPFETAPGDYLVVPMNEGISYPVDDPAISPQRLIAYGGHGICMAFWGVTDGKAGHLAIIETPDDAAIQIQRLDARLVVRPEWDPQKQTFGYTRRLRFVFFDQGGHVAIAKRYRAHAKETGLLKTLAEKRQANSNVDLLMGAVNVWCWDRDAVSIAKEMQTAGIEKILWSNRQSPESLRALNEMGVLTSRYDIYQDVMDPAQFHRFRGVHPDWVTPAWPKDIILDARGQWLKGWGVETTDNDMVHCGVICDLQALSYARDRAPTELATHPYRCRFIDTTTAAPWNECYATNHPMTRSESKQWKMELLRYFSEDLKLVTGCETGHDASVPFLHYFEGMLSLGPYRVPDSGRRMNVIWTNVPEAVAKFQLGQEYRLPLWELVYHDCVVAQWYWGDYNNKLPALWDKRDLFNVLYGTPPMFMFDRKLWEQNRERFVQSYRNTCPHVRESAYAEMTDHQFLTLDRAVQRTRFANGQAVTVNFGSTPYRLEDGTTLEPMGFRVVAGPPH